MSKRSILTLSLFALVGWVFSICLCLSPSIRFPQSRADRSQAAQAPDTLKIVRLSDLVAEGFDSATLRRIRPHIDVLNTAVRTVISFHHDYQTATTADERRVAEASAASFHETADRHEQTSVPTDEIRCIFWVSASDANVMESLTQ